MSRRDLRPLDPKVLSLLASEKIPVVQEAEVKARAFARATAAASRPVASPIPVHRSWRDSRARLSLAAAGVVLITAAGGSAAFRAWRNAGHPFGGQAGPASPSAPGPVAEPRHEPRPEKLAPTDAERVAAELWLLQRARVSVTRRDFSDALVLISEHERQFPTGPLTEEREALRIRSLSGLGRIGEARRAATAFRVRFPRSVLLSHMNEISQKASE